MTDPADGRRRRTYVISSSSEDEDEAAVLVTEVNAGGGVSPRTLLAIQEAVEPRSGSDGEDPGVSVSSQSRTPLILRSDGSESQEETRESAGNPLLMQRHTSASSDHRPVNADRTDQTEDNKVKSEDEEESSSEGTSSDKVFSSSPF